MIKDETLYLKRMASTMTREEKLFFLNQLDINEYDYVIDFGGADGTLIKELQRHRLSDEQSLHINSCVTYFIVDNYFVKSEKCLYDGFKEHTYIKTSLKELLGHIDPRCKILFILSSVLHELNINDEFIDLVNFCINYVDTVVIRDMCFSSKRTTFNEDEYSLTVSLQDKDPKFKEVLELTAGSSWLIGLYEYFLKYEFTYNWENEIKEFYLQNNIKTFEKLVSKAFDITYEKNYILPYKKKKVKEDFNFNMTLPTHRQVILERVPNIPKRTVEREEEIRLMKDHKKAEEAFIQL